MPSSAPFHRSATDTKLAGVCGGAAERWGVDPVLVRVGAVLLALTGGVGVILYVAAWLLLPVAGQGRAVVDDLFGGAAARWPRELWVTLVVVASVLSLAVFGAVSPFGPLPAFALLALWWFGFRRPRVRQRREAARRQAQEPAPYAVPPGSPAGPTWQGPPTPFTQAAYAWQARVAEVRSGVWAPAPLRQAQGATPAAVPPFQTRGPAAPVPAPAPFVAPQDPEAAAQAAFLAEPDPVGLYDEPAPLPVVRPGASLAARRLRLVTLTVLGLTWLGLGVADAAGVAVGLAVYAGSGLLVLALGLVAATRLGRARGLLPAAAVVAVAAVAVSGFVGPALSAPVRNATRLAAHPVAYTSAAAFPAGGDSLDVGELDVDLTGLRLGADATYAADVDGGRIVVRTPPGVGVRLRYDVDAGHVTAYGSPVDAGTDLTEERLVVPPTVGQHTLTLDLSVDTGTIEVRS